MARLKNFEFRLSSKLAFAGEMVTLPLLLQLAAALLEQEQKREWEQDAVAKQEMTQTALQWQLQARLTALILQLQRLFSRRL